MNKRIRKFFLCGLMIFKVLTVGFSITAKQGVCLHYAIIIKFYVTMYIHQNMCIKAPLRHRTPVASFNKKKGCAAPFVEQLLS